VRYKVRIEFRDNTTLEGTIVSEQQYKIPQEKRSMIVSMPNKRDKVELIVQKLTECALDQIIFRPSERSVIKERNTKKAERINKIIKEAVEQSRGRTIPELHFATDIKEYLKDTEVIIFNKTVTKEITPPQPSPLHGEGAVMIIPSLMPAPYISLRGIGEGVGSEVTTITGVIGPEGGFTPRDYQQFEAYKPKIVGLDETVLRTETAAII